MRLGKQPKRHDHRNLKLNAYTGELQAAPRAVDRTSSISKLGMMCNDTIGNCTCAAAAHIIQAWTAEAGNEFITPDNTVVAAYTAVSGYNPADPATDNGAACLDVLNYWRKTGFAGHTIGATLEISPVTEGEIEKALYYFGAVYTGFNLPKSCEGRPCWDTMEGVGSAPGSWGGHCVPIVAYDEFTVTVITWGKLLRVTWPFVRKYCDEAYVTLSNDIICGTGTSPEGFNLAQLQADLTNLTA